MKIGIVTYHHSVSYGAFMQSYAFFRYLSGLGHDVKFIDYNPAHRDNKVRPWSNRFFGFHPQNLVYRFKYRSFSDYVKRYLPLTKRSYRTLAELRDDPPDMDAYICGSDQIWNPVHIGDGFDPAYFACFGKPQTKRIAYAASLGSGSLSDNYHQSLCDNVSNMNHISVREKGGCDLVTSITGRQCEHVLDPTLLVSDYSELYKSKPLIKQPYVLVFNLIESAWFQKTLEAVNAVSNLPFVFVGSYYKWWMNPGKTRFCTPGKWLNLFSNAKAVITNSFHGTVFSLNFKKPFISVGLSGKIASRNVRIIDLLKAVQLEDRFVSEDSSTGNVELITVNPDWANVEKCLSGMKTNSVEFLSRALSKSN
jgi:hypothetical protein